MKISSQEGMDYDVSQQGIVPYLSAARLAICEYKYCVKQKVIIGLFFW